MDDTLHQAEGPRKRQRTDSGSGRDLPGHGAEIATANDLVDTATRDSDYWFKDGNIILISRGVAFRVYRGLLEEHSVVFESMFHVGQAPQALSDQAYGCPVIPLDDSPEDLRSLFRALYPLNKNIRHTSAAVDINFISAIIHLDDKYELKGLYDWAMGYLTKFYTTSFDAWTDVSHTLEWCPEPKHAITAVKLARDTGTLTILPTALYVCATLGPDIALGVEHDDGTCEYLAPEDLRLCLTLKNFLVAANSECAFALFRQITHTPSSTQPCHTPGICSDLLRRVFEQACTNKGPRTLSSGRALESWIDALDALPAPAPIPMQAQMGMPPPMPPMMMGPGNGFNGVYYYMPSPPAPPLCTNCRAQLEKRDWELRRQVWRKLPGWIGLNVENWDART